MFTGKSLIVNVEITILTYTWRSWWGLDDDRRKTTRWYRVTPLEGKDICQVRIFSFANNNISAALKKSQGGFHKRVNRHQKKPQALAL